MGNAFLSGFLVTLQFLLVILGGVSAVMLCTAVVCFVVFGLASVFDLVTGHIAKRWKKKGKKPKGKIGRVILRSVLEDGGV